MKNLAYVMNKPVIFCHPDDNLAIAGALLWEHNCGALPVVDNDGRLQGMITDRDICIALTTRNMLAADIFVSEVMSTNISSCSADNSINDAVKMMRNAKVRRVPVVDRDHKLIGIISLTDILLRTNEFSSAALILRSIYEKGARAAVAGAN
jgi:CBS domain-containing protein